jgi:hypothetical protein
VKKLAMKESDTMKRPYLIVIAVLVLGLTAHAINLNVYCGQKRIPNTINGALKVLNPQGPNTLTVSGTCKENVVIKSFDNLTLQAMQATPGASINDASGGTADVIVIQDSTRITIQGFTINGGGEGVLCFDHSLCRFNGNTIQGSSGNGVRLSRARATFTGNVIQKHSGNGLGIANASQAYTNGDTIQGNVGGVFVSGSSFLIASATTVQDNSSMGVVIADNSTLNTGGGNLITGNGDTGVFVIRASMAYFGNGDAVTANGYGFAEYGGDGVGLGNLSFVRVNGANISDNFSGTDVNCREPLAATEIDFSFGGTTNCVAPSQPSSQAKPRVP